MQRNQQISFSLPHFTHLDGIWMKHGLLRNWDKGFTFLFLESKVKFTTPYLPTLLPLAQEKGLWFSFFFMGLVTFGISSTLLWTRPSHRSLPGEGAGKEDVICLGQYEVNEPFLAVGLQASLSNIGSSCAHSGRSQSSYWATYWLAPQSSFAACLDTVGFLEGWGLAQCRLESSMIFFHVETLGSSLSQIMCGDFWT